MPVSRPNPEQEVELITLLHAPDIKDNLYNFVMAAYPWGKKGTWLEQMSGPRDWQREDLEEISAHIRENQQRMAQGLPPRMFKKATASGRGVGKSALVAWLSNWMMTTRLGSTTIVTANTEPQLKSRTFAEISKWTNLLINQHWFESTVLSIRPAPWFAELLKTQLSIDTGYYYVQGQLWAEENPDGFAGVHNPLGILVIKDEASGIPSPIFTVTAGFFTESTPDRYWLAYSNPRRNSGGFYDCFHNPTSDWRKRHLDARTIAGLDPTVFQNLIDKYGIDSDQVRVEVLGQFPKQGNEQFIGNHLVYAAQMRDVQEDPGAPLILGVDVARYGYAKTVFRFRKGRDARSIPPIRFQERDNMYIANKLVEVSNHYRPDVINIDAGNGTGVIDRCRELGLKVREVWFGGSPASKEWANKRTEMWADLRDWLGGGCIDLDPCLFTDLTAPEYTYFGKAKDAIMLETKESLYSRGISSADDGDALALTFAHKVARRDNPASKTGRRDRVAQGVDYELFA